MFSRPPRGGRGLKVLYQNQSGIATRRRPPRGGRGLKDCSYTALTVLHKRRPPRGGRGLKVLQLYYNTSVFVVALPVEGVD